MQFDDNVTDETNRHTITASNISYASGVFSNSVVCNGTSSSMTAPDSADWDAGTSDLAFAFWAYYDSSKTFSGSYYPYALSHYESSSERWIVLVDSSGGGMKFVSIEGGSAQTIQEVSAPSYNTWYYYAFARSSGTMRMYRAALGSATASKVGEETINNTISNTGLLTIGVDGTADANSILKGNIDELIFIKGTDNGWTGATIPVQGQPYDTVVSSSSNSSSSSSSP